MGTTNTKSKRYYIDGNTVREINPEEERRKRIERRRKEEERIRRNRRNAARRNRERTFVMSRSYVIFLTVCVLISAYTAGYYVKLQSEVSSYMDDIADMESKLEDLKTDNDARYKSINTSVDLDYIKDVAINQLGMKYATEDQIVYYSVDNSNFMNQYSDIPNQ